MTNRTYNVDLALYVAIAVLGALQSLQDPITWRSALGVIVVGLVTWKAKRSGGKDQVTPPDDTKVAP